MIANEHRFTYSMLPSSSYGPNPDLYSSSEEEKEGGMRETSTTDDAAPPPPPTQVIPPTALRLKMSGVSAPPSDSDKVHALHTCIKISPDIFCVGESDVTIGQLLKNKHPQARERRGEQSFKTKGDGGGGGECFGSASTAIANTIAAVRRPHPLTPTTELSATSFCSFDHGSPSNSAWSGTTGGITLCFPPKALVRRPSIFTPSTCTSTASEGLDLSHQIRQEEEEDVFIGACIAENKDTHHTNTRDNHDHETTNRDTFGVDGDGDTEEHQQERRQPNGLSFPDGNCGAFRIDADNDVDGFYDDEHPAAKIAECISSPFFRPRPLFVEYTLPRHYRQEDIATAKSLACTTSIHKRERKGVHGAPKEEEVGRERERAYTYCSSNERRGSYSSCCCSSYSAGTAFLGGEESLMGVTSEPCFDDCDGGERDV